MDLKVADPKPCEEWSFKGRQTTDFFTRGDSRLIAVHDNERVVPALLISRKLALKLEEAIRSRRQHQDIATQLLDTISRCKVEKREMQVNINMIRYQIKHMEERLKHADTEEETQLIERLSALQKKKAEAESDIETKDEDIKGAQKKLDDTADYTKMRWLDFDDLIIDVWERAGFMDPDQVQDDPLPEIRTDPEIIEQARHHLSILRDQVRKARQTYKSHAERTDWGLTKEGMDLLARLRKEQEEYKAHSERWLALGIPERDLLGVAAWTDNMDSCHLEHPVAKLHEAEDLGNSLDRQVIEEGLPPPPIVYEDLNNLDDGIPVGEGAEDRARRATAQRQDPRRNRARSEHTPSTDNYLVATEEPVQRGKNRAQSSRSGRGDHGASRSPGRIQRQPRHTSQRPQGIQRRRRSSSQRSLSAHQQSLLQHEADFDAAAASSDISSAWWSATPPPRKKRPTSRPGSERGPNMVSCSSDLGESHSVANGVPEANSTREKSASNQSNRSVQSPVRSSVQSSSHEDRTSNTSSAKKRKHDTSNENEEAHESKRVRTPPPNDKATSEEPRYYLRNPQPPTREQSLQKSPKSRKGGQRRQPKSSSAESSNRGSYDAQSQRDENSHRSKSSSGEENHDAGSAAGSVTGSKRGAAAEPAHDEGL